MLARGTADGGAFGQRTIATGKVVGLAVALPAAAAIATAGGQITGVREPARGGGTVLTGLAVAAPGAGGEGDGATPSTVNVGVGRDATSVPHTFSLRSSHKRRIKGPGVIDGDVFARGGHPLSAKFGDGRWGTFRRETVTGCKPHWELRQFGPVGVQGATTMCVVYPMALFVPGRVRRAPDPACVSLAKVPPFFQSTGKDVSVWVRGFTVPHFAQA